MIIKIALVQQKANTNDLECNLLLADKYCKQAKLKGADIILFPEMWSNGYTLPFKQGGEISQRFIGNVKDIAKKNKINVAITALSKGNKKPRNTAFLIDQNGNLLMEYHKVHTCDFGYEQDLENGNTFKVCEININESLVKVGIMICYDREFPESARILMLKGAEIILVPNACDMNKARLDQISTRAFENMVGIAMANYPNKGWGNSCAYSPIVFDDNGNYTENQIFIADDVSQDIFIAEFDMDLIREYREKETWGNSYRKVKAYNQLTDKQVQYPFIRKDNQK